MLCAGYVHVCYERGLILHAYVDFKMHRRNCRTGLRTGAQHPNTGYCDRLHLLVKRCAGLVAVMTAMLLVDIVTYMCKVGWWDQRRLLSIVEITAVPVWLRPEPIVPVL